MTGEGKLISRGALERIIRRAAELQAQDHDIDEGLTPEDVVALGREVGIPARYLQQALLEEDGRIGAAARGPLGWLVGPPALAATRVVPGERPAVERALEAALDREELLQVKRRYADGATWEPKAGALASLVRALGTSGRRFALAWAAEVMAQVTALEPGVCHVQLRADVRNLRRQRLGGAAALLGFGALVTAIAPALNVLFPWLLLPLAFAALAAAAYARGGRRADERVRVGLEQVLDRLERGEIKPEHQLPGSGLGTLGRIADELRGLLSSGHRPGGRGVW
jgi:hypothetical protein